MRLSIAMIVKNEELNLDRTLKALKKVRESIKTEIVIVDTGSDDRTVEIANKHDAKVYYHEWCNDFAYMRNKSISYCRGEWILILDADEVLENADEIISLFKTRKIDKYNTSTIKVKNYSYKDDDGSSIGNIYRLFKRASDVKYIGIIHERPQCKEPVLVSNIIINHYGYLMDDYKLMNYKFKRNTELLFKYLEKNGDDIYSYFQLSQSYALAGKEQEALIYVNKAVDLMNTDKLKSKYLFVLALYYKKLHNNRKYDKCIEVCNQVKEINNTIPDLYYLLSSCYFSKSDYENTIIYGEMYLDKLKKWSENWKTSIDVEQFSINRQDDVVNLIILAYFKQEKYKACLEMFEKNSQSKEKLNYEYYFSLMMTERIKELSEHIKIKKADIKYEAFFQALNNKIITIDYEGKIAFLKKLLNIENIIDLYINIVELKNYDYTCKSELDFEEYARWKSMILNELIKKDISNINILMSISYDGVFSYVQNMMMDYECIELLLNYSKDNVFANDINTLLILDKIELCLIESDKVTSEELKYLTVRKLINKKSMINIMYKEDVLDKSVFKHALNREDRFWYMLMKIVGMIETDIGEYISKMKDLVKEFNSHKKIFEVVNNFCNTKTIDETIKKEKENIMIVIENMINNGEVEACKGVISELIEIIGINSEIYNVNSIIAYIEEDKERLFNNLTCAYILTENRDDVLYNISEALRSVGREKDANKYFKQ